MADSYGVSFHVLPSSSIDNLQSGDVVIFDDVRHNGGGYYNQTSGEFTCPLEGVYVFSVQVGEVNTKDVELSVYKNDANILTTTFTESKHATISVADTGHALTICHCKNGDKVKAKVTNPATPSSIQGRPRTVFAGALLYGSRASSTNQVQ
jgi:hypothetical protein